MKQTSGALSFLLSAYRSIFSAAYAKGIAAAVVLTAGLAAGASQAAELNLSPSFEAAKDAAITVVNDASGSSISLPADTGTQPGLKYANGMNVTAPLTVTGYGSVAVTGDMTINGKLTVTGTASGGKATQIFGTDQEMAKDRKSWVTDHTVNFGSNADVEMSNNASITFETVNIDGSKIKLNGSATITAWGYGEAPSAQSSFDDTVNYLNADMSIRNAEISLSGSTTMDANDGMSISNTKIDVTGGTGNTIRALLQGNADEMTVSDSQITVAKSSALKIETTSVSMTGGSLTNNEGTITFTGDAEIDDSVTVKSTGTTNFSGDLTTTASALEGLTKEGKLSMSATEADLNVTDAVDLNKLGIIKADGKTDGALDTAKLAITGKVNFNADDVTLGHTYAVGADKLTLNVKNLTATTTDRAGVVSGVNGGFFIDNGTINVSDKLTLNAGSGDTGETRLYVYGKSGDATLNLVNDGSVTGTLDDVDRIYVGYTSATAYASNNGTLTVNGNWNFAGTRLTVGKSGDVTLGGTVDNIGSLWLNASDATLTVATGADVTVGRLGETNDATAGTINVNGTLTISGDGVAETKGANDKFANDITIMKTTVVINNGGILDVSNKDVQDDFITVGAGTEKDGNTFTVSKTVSGDLGAWTASKVDLKAGGTLKLNLAGNRISTTNLKTLKKDLAGDDFKGSFEFGGLEILLSEDEKKDLSGDTVDYSDLTSAGINDVSTSQVAGKTVNVSAATEINLVNQASVHVTDGTSAKVNGTLALSGKDGNYVTGKDGDKTVTADITLKVNSGVNFTGNGTVGDIKKDHSVTGTSALLTGNFTVGEVDVEDAIFNGTIKSTENLTADTLTLTGAYNNANTTDDTSKNTTVTLKDASFAGTVITNTFKVGEASNASGAGTLAGRVEADSFEIVSGTDNTLTLAGGQIVADKVTTNGHDLLVGTETTDEAASSNGYLFAGTLDLGGGALILDPDYSAAASVAEVRTGSDPAKEDIVDIGGDLGVGMNSLASLGAEASEAMSVAQRLGFMSGNRMTEGNVGSMLYLGKTMDIGAGDVLILNAEGTSDDLSAAIGTVSGSLAGSGASVSLGANTALVVSESLTEEIINDTSKAIFTVAGDSSQDPTFTFDAQAGSKIVFDSATVIGGDTVNVFTGKETDDIYDIAINGEVLAANGLLIGKQDAADENVIKFELNKDEADALLFNQSNPVKALTKEVVGNTDRDYTVNDDLGVDYIVALNAHNGGADIEQTARLATYAGAVQATFMAQQTSTDAVADRMGMASVNSALVYADNAQGGGLWLMPVYKNHDSDSFDAQGVDYGADIDLYGVALGADFTSDSGVRVGGYFNVGSGDADGQGVGSDVSNDFDYFGLGLYAGVNFGNFGLVADAGFTQVSNDIEQSVNYHDIGKVTADTDTTAVTVGVKGEYKLALDVVDVVPHIGVRYTNFDMDSYDAKVDGQVVATTSADNMTVFSIPFGVSLSKEIAAGDWTVKPAFDLTLTANAGDTEFDTDTTFIGTDGLGLSTEVLDDFTYGGALGIQAKYGESLSLGVSASYVGSDNADEFGLTGDIRYMF